jgi:single-strand DNA-binding protein
VDGLHCAFIGRVGQDAELKFTSNGSALVSVSVSVQDSKAEQTQWIRIGHFGDADGEAEDLARQLVKGTECYIEGRLKLKTWQGADGGQRSGLDCHAWKLEVLSRIGRRAQWRGRVDQHADANQQAMPQAMAIPPRGAA